MGLRDGSSARIRELGISVMLVLLVVHARAKDTFEAHLIGRESLMNGNVREIGRL